MFENVLIWSDVTEAIFRLGSTSPASVLLDAVDQLEKRSPKADDNIQLIRPNLVEAVDACVEAAGNEYDVHWQKQLLKAASFGKSVLDLYSSDDFVDMCEALRVLNAVRYYEIGLPISHDQFIRLGPERLVQRLINRREYLLALRVSEYLRLPAEKIYIHWASQKVRVSTDDEDNICRLIVSKLRDKRGVSFEEIARAAHDEGRSRLATELLNYEPRAGKQVPLLLLMEEDEIALDKAIESGDTDLIYFVLLHLRSKLPLTSFFRVINNRPTASALVESSARAQDEDLLTDLYYQDDRRLDAAMLLFRESLSQPTLDTSIHKLKLSSNSLADSKPHVFELRAIDEAGKLLRLQEGYNQDIGEPFTGLSLNATLFKLTRLGYSARAKKLAADFKAPEKSVWWIRLRALVAKRDWAELEEMGKPRNSSIGWEPFFNEILGAGNTKLASTFISKCTTLSPSERAEMWVKCGMQVEAAKELSKVKDIQGLESLKNKATASAVGEIERMIAKLRPR